MRSVDLAIGRLYVPPSALLEGLQTPSSSPPQLISHPTGVLLGTCSPTPSFSKLPSFSYVAGSLVLRCANIPASEKFLCLSNVDPTSPHQLQWSKPSMDPEVLRRKTASRPLVSASLPRGPFAIIGAVVSLPQPWDACPCASEQECDARSNVGPFLPTCLSLLHLSVGACS